MPWLDTARDWAVRHDERRLARDPTASAERAGVVAAGWAIAKIAAVAVSGPVLAPLVGIWAARNTRLINEAVARYPAFLDAVLRGDVPARVARLPVSGRYFIASDLHRTVPGTIDLPGRHGTRELYEVVLEHYGQHCWTLVENGDVEDFWMVGGSTYGSFYDVTRLAAATLPRRRGEAIRLKLFSEHLRRIVANNAGIYERINALFHEPGRYVRLIGNHDDVYADERMVDELRAVHEGLEVLDFLVLDGEDGAVGVVTHGHHVDTWNAPRFAGLGKFGTWMGSTLNDLPFLAVSPGIPTVQEADRLLSGAQPNVLTTVSRVFGANRNLYSVDEVRMLASFRSHWAEGADPILILGHTHLPLAHPHHPDEPVVWDRYLNCGSGVTPGVVTGIEWVGGTDGSGKGTEVHLIAWHWADPSTPDEAVVAQRDGRGVARRILQPGSPLPVLRPVPG
ncbi:MAG: hypothetical protein N2037_01860 [Acidimicrobiales bacterium]|nr:hypothetical protein [Acidimicrobiales bacterium]